MAFLLPMIGPILGAATGLFALNDQIGNARLREQQKQGGQLKYFSRINSASKNYISKRIPRNKMRRQRRQRGKGLKRRMHRRAGRGVLGQLVGNIPILGPLINAIGLGLPRGRRVLAHKMLKGGFIPMNARQGSMHVGGLLAPTSGNMKKMYGGLLGPVSGGRVRKHLVKGHYRYLTKGKSGRGIRRIHVPAHMSKHRTRRMV